MKVQKLFLILIGLILTLSALFCLQNLWEPEKREVYETKCGIYSQKSVIIGNKKIFADISDTDCKRTIGLSGRSLLKDNEGMLFIFDVAGSHGFWMKDMRFPIDILWVGNDLSIIGIEKNLKPSTYPEIFGKNYMAKYVLELPAGFSNENKLNIGEKLIF